MIIKFLCTLLLSAAVCITAHAEHRQCIILLDDTENIGKLNPGALIITLQTAIAERAAPILVNASLLNLFNERRLMIEQNQEIPDSREKKVYDFFKKMDERFAYWSNHYNNLGSDTFGNKELVRQKINKEFYLAEDRINLSPTEYELLLDYTVPFNLNDWCIYKNDKGYYLLIPGTYSECYEDTGFKIDSLQQVTDPFDTAALFFETQEMVPLGQALPDFFITHDEAHSLEDAYTWTIVLYGHGGIFCKENNENNIVSWTAGASIANMTVQEFKTTLAFFNVQVRTHCLYYISCYAGGNHTQIIFDTKEGYNFPLVCGTLTDCVHKITYRIPVPSSSENMLKPSDVVFDNELKSWKLQLKNRLKWKAFFNKIVDINFSTGSIECLPSALGKIKTNYVCNIPLLCLPGETSFFPIHRGVILKVDDLLIESAEQENEEKYISVYGHEIVLLQSTLVHPSVRLEWDANYRFISIKPGDALHYFNSIESVHYLDLPSLFWQVEGQMFDKTFLIDACTFALKKDERLFKEVSVSGNNIALKNVLIMQHASNYIRLFYTVGDASFMAVAHKPDENKYRTTVQQVVKLSAVAHARYEAYYDSLRQSFQNEELNDTGHVIEN